MNSRIKILVRGVVQGVGFRPFVYSLAKSLNLKGFVMNSSKGVTIEIEGNDSSLFVERLKNEAPPLSQIMRSVPYDRPNTTMSVFQLCAECNKEYHNPEDRRFHAQPNACQVCGPHVKLIVKNKNNPPSPPFTKGGMGGLLDETPKVDKKGNPPKETIRLLKEGYIVAIKGLGGFHLACDASSERAVRRLR